MKKILAMILCFGMCVSFTGCGGKNLKNAKVGDKVNFGSYEQDNNTSNGKEDLSWKVLAKEDGKLLLITDKAIDCKQFHSEREEVHWEGSDIREWLNREFLDETFSSEDLLKLEFVETDDEVEDRVFLLSADEAEEYFESDEARRANATEYAKEKGAVILEELGTTSWWLRSDGTMFASADRVVPAGAVYTSGKEVDEKIYTIRPAVWVSVE